MNHTRRYERVVQDVSRKMFRPRCVEGFIQLVLVKFQICSVVVCPLESRLVVDIAEFLQVFVALLYLLTELFQQFLLFVVAFLVVFFTGNLFKGTAMRATLATQSGGCLKVPRVPRKVQLHVAKCHACHAKSHTTY